MRILLLLLCTIAASTHPKATQAQVAANAPGLLELDDTQHHPVPLTPEEVIRAADDPLPAGLTPIQQAIRSRDRIYNGMVSVELSVVLSLNGRVESAKPISGPQRFYEQAVEIEMHRAFQPVRDESGTIVRAHFTDGVSVVPPEKWLAHSSPFPEQVDPRTFSITLERTGCLGSCPNYKVTVAGSGDIKWEGGQYTAVLGTHHATISREAVQELVDQVRASRMLAALDKYEASWTDNPASTLTLDVNGLHKQVIDYIGLIVGMPGSIRNLEDAVDRIAGTEKWLKGNADLMPALADEHWDFGADSKDNLQLYNSALEHGNPELVAAFIAAHGPALSADPAVDSPVCVASGLNESNFALDILSALPKDRKLPQRVLDDCLVAAAGGGNLELANLWLKRGASLSPAPLPHSDSESTRPISPLIAAINRGSPVVVQRLLEAHAPLDPALNYGHNLVTFAVEYCRADHLEDKLTIVKMLLDAGVDPNQETDNVEPALFAIYSEPELVPLLVRGGAKVNGRDHDGDTPLMRNTYIGVLRALLEAGADPTLRNRKGQTAGESFRAQGMKEQADLLDAAAKARSEDPHTRPASIPNDAIHK